MSWAFICRVNRIRNPSGSICCDHLNSTCISLQSVIWAEYLLKTMKNFKMPNIPDSPHRLRSIKRLYDKYSKWSRDLREQDPQPHKSQEPPRKNGTKLREPRKNSQKIGIFLTRNFKKSDPPWFLWYHPSGTFYGQLENTDFVPYVRISRIYYYIWNLWSNVNGSHPDSRDINLAWRSN